MSSHSRGDPAPPAETEVEAKSRELLLHAVLTEYSALRNEIDTAGGNLYAASWQGALALGATFAAGAAVLGESRVVSAIIFGAGGIGIASYFIVLWADEVFRVIRVGEYVRHFIENKVQKLAGTIPDFEPNLDWPGREEDSRLEWESPLAFERYLQSNLHKHQFPWFQRTHYRVTHLPFYLVGVAAAGISGYLIWQEDWSKWFLALPAIGAAILTGLWAWYVWQVRQMMGAHYKYHFGPEDDLWPL